MKLISFLTFLVISYFIYGFYISQSNLATISPELKNEHPDGFYDYRGIANVRTNLSNGSSSPTEVISEAKAAGLDFLIFTDVNQFDRSESLNGYNGNLMVMNEGEYSFLDSRLLYLSQDESKLPNTPAETSVYFADLLSQEPADGKDHLLVLAHPFNPSQTWTGSYPPGLDGIEILNPRAVSQRAWLRSKLNVAWSLIIYPFNPRYSFLRLFREPREELLLWDKLSEGRMTWGFAGADASARAIPFANALIKFPSYKMSMEIANNHVLLESELTGNYQKDRQKIFSALRKGNFYSSIDLLGDPKGFNAVIKDKDRTYLMGSKLKFSRGLKIISALPIEPKDFFEVVVLKDGERALTKNTRSLEFEIKEPGVYRLVVRVSPTLPLPDGKKWISWIYTNPFYVTP